jgi:translation initiation factor 5A
LLQGDELKTTAIIKELKPNSFVLIEGVPCRVEKVTISVAGKHGAAKARIEAIGLFDGRRRSIVKPADETIEVPIVEKKRAQVLALLGERVQLMDLMDFSVFELEIPEEKKGKIVQGEEIDYFEVIGIKTLKEIK